MLKKTFSKIARSLPLYRELRQARDILEQIRVEISAFRAMESVRHALELEHHPRYGQPRRLHRFAFQVNSQNGEDGMIHEIFQRIGTSNRIFVEVGVGNGTENNTAFLLSQGWTGFWIDGNSDFLQTIKRSKNLKQDCLTSYVSFVNKENVAGIFTQLGVPEEFDLLSLDIDQNTYYIWEALHTVKPRVVVAEYNAAIPPSVDWKAQYAADRIWDGTQNFGASLKTFEKLGARLGYSLVGCDFVGANAFFVRNDLVADKFAEPFTAENHYEPPRYGYLFQRGHARTILDSKE